MLFGICSERPAAFHLHADPPTILIMASSIERNASADVAAQQSTIPQTRLFFL